MGLRLEKCSLKRQFFVSEIQNYYVFFGMESKIIMFIKT